MVLAVDALLATVGISHALLWFIPLLFWVVRPRAVVLASVATHGISLMPLMNRDKVKRQQKPGRRHKATA